MAFSWTELRTGRRIPEHSSNEQEMSHFENWLSQRFSSALTERK